MDLKEPTPLDDSYMQTVCGKMFSPLRSTEADVHIQDIGHALSNICRFGGHTSEFYSVAQHSVLVSMCVEDMMLPSFSKEWLREASLWAMLHDASEAYIGDAIWPLKRLREWAAFCDVERRLDGLVANRFGFDFAGRHAAIKPIVKWADASVLLAEARDFMNNPRWARDRVGREGMMPYPDTTIVALPPKKALELFRLRWDHLYREAVQS